MELVDTYKQQLHRFMAGTTVDEFKALFPAPSMSSALSAEKFSIKLKLENFWGDKTLSDLLKLVTLLGIPGDYLHLSKVEDGNCIAVIWLCSTSHITELIMKMHEVAESLQAEGVLQLYVGEHLVSGSMEEIDWHQLDTAELGGVEICRHRVQHQKVKQAATCEVKSFTEYVPSQHIVMSNAELSIPNLEQKLKEEGLNATNWREVGLKLGLPSSRLQVIEADVYPPSQQLCLYKMLNDWFRQDSTATMEKYTRALRLVNLTSLHKKDF